MINFGSGSGERNQEQRRTKVEPWCEHWSCSGWRKGTFVTGSAKRGLIAFPIVCIWPSIVRHVSMVSTWNLVTLHSWHGSIPGGNFTSMGWTHYELQLIEVGNEERLYKTFFTDPVTFWDEVTLNSKEIKPITLVVIELRLCQIVSQSVRREIC